MLFKCRQCCTLYSTHSTQCYIHIYKVVCLFLIVMPLSNPQNSGGVSFQQISSCLLIGVLFIVASPIQYLYFYSIFIMCLLGNNCYGIILYGNYTMKYRWRWYLSCLQWYYCVILLHHIWSWRPIIESSYIYLRITRQHYWNNCAVIEITNVSENMFRTLESNSPFEISVPWTDAVSNRSPAVQLMIAGD